VDGSFGVWGLLWETEQRITKTVRFVPQHTRPPDDNAGKIWEPIGMTVLLAGDIGGTKTILRLVETQGETDRQIPDLATRYEQTYSSHDYADLVPMIRQFLDAAAGSLGDLPQPERACFGIAGPVVHETCKLTNLSWFLEADRLQRELGIDQVNLINDFAAIGYGVLGLSDDELHPLQEVQPDTNAPIAILGAGTGLGEAFLVRSQGNYQIFGTEGGHTDFAPRTELEFALQQYLLEKNNIDRVSVERVVSGQGIISIYQFLRDRDGSRESPELAEVFKIWTREMGKTPKTVNLAAEISQAALEERDYLCEQTLKLFIEAYGVEAGNFALKLLPYGGLYVAGGIAAKILPLMERGDFLRSFLQKGRVSPLLERVPIYIVLNPQVGLIGAALYAARSI
jgi:glucokinase